MTRRPDIRSTSTARARACVDKQAAAWLKERPDLAVEIDDSTCYGEFPRTFNEVFASIARDRQLVQVQTL